MVGDIGSLAGHHQPAHRGVDKRLTSGAHPLVILAHPPVLVRPSLDGVDLRRFRGLFKSESSARKGEQCHEQTRHTHRSFAEKLSGWLGPPTRNIPGIAREI